METRGRPLTMGLPLGLALIAIGSASSQKETRPPEIPKRALAVGSSAELAAGKTVAVLVESRRAEAPASATWVEGLRREIVKALRGTQYHVVGDGQAADLRLEMLIDPSVRYGMFHYQIAPYNYLLLRDGRSGRLLYCSYERLAVLHSASASLLGELRHTLAHLDQVQSTAVDSCAAQAMRPVQ